MNRTTRGRCFACFILIGAGGGVSIPVAAQDPVPTAWQLIDDGDPVPWSSFPLAYDTIRHRAILIESGMANDAPSMHWELVGEDWVRRYLPGPTPGLTGGTCLAWDLSRGRAVLFGGGEGDDETWEFDGDVWTRRITQTVPTERYQCTMTYDEANERIVMFGGVHPDTGQSLPDTWEYDGTDWADVSPVASPPRRGWAGFAYDASRERSVLFGGMDSGIPKADLWEYDGRRKRWSQKTPSSGPSARVSPGMAYDTLLQRVLLFGGRGFGGDLGDTWEWNGQSWTQRTPPTAPSARYGFHMVWDIERQKVLGWGGELDEGAFNDTWLWNGTTWERIAISGSPEVRASHAMGYDPIRGAIVLYGGRGFYPYSGAPLWDTWHWTPDGWVRQQNAGTATAGEGFPLVFDESSDRLVGFGGAGWSGVPESTDLHEYTGSPPSWSSNPSCCPDERMNHGWAHAPALGGTILYGGLACCFVNSNYTAEDTWRLVGQDWEQLFPTTAPGKRRSMAMAFDATRGNVVLYGGYDGFLDHGDTWLFDGQTWTMRCDACPPGARVATTLVFDTERRISVLYGDGDVSEGVTWEFDGESWIARSTPWQPEPFRCHSAMAYDAARSVVVLFGGTDCLGGGTRRNDTWAYGADPDADGKVGGLDNCRDVANPGQEDLDGDAAGDVCDCAAADPSVWALPKPVTGLELAGSLATTIHWDDQSPTAGTGVLYDVATGDLAELRTGSWVGASCLASQTAVPNASDSRVPAFGAGYWYLVRARNACGIGTYGAGALDASTPCP